MNIKMLMSSLMINSTYLYWFFLFFCIVSLVFFLINFRSSKNELNNKILLKNLLESLDVDLPEELKTLDSSPADTQNLS